MTLQDTQAIFQKHHLPFKTIEKSSIGFRNDVFLTEQFVLKCYPDHNTTGFQKELWFYQTVKPDFAPRLIAYGKNYIILERIWGTVLFRLWRSMTDSQREDTVAKIAGMIQKINQVDYRSGAPYLHIPSSWKKHLLSRIEESVSMLRNSKGISEQLAVQVLEYAKKYGHCLDESSLFLVYADLHFDNLLVAYNGAHYPLDFEMLEIAPLDFVLDVWQRMQIHPFIYANEDDHELTKAKDYASIMLWLKKYAPELFLSPNVRERVDLYGFAYELDMLQRYPMADGPLHRIQSYLNGVAW